VLSERFTPLAQEFVQKKYHNLSHLKELGIIFMIPTRFNQAGQLMKIFGLAFHYVHELEFYADLIRTIADRSENFARSFITLLRGDTPKPAPSQIGTQWFEIQRYLEKDDPNELAIMTPHINPESLHWTRAQQDIARLSPDLGFWNDLDWVAAMARDDIGESVLVSFNLIDIAMSMADRAVGRNYTYHQREAMWNKLFAGYYGWETLEKELRENLETGIVTL
jgi:hypothetical protein